MASITICDLCGKDIANIPHSTQAVMVSVKLSNSSTISGPSKIWDLHENCYDNMVRWVNGTREKKAMDFKDVAEAK